MIVKWNEQRINVIPIKNTESNRNKGTIILLPGCNEVAEKYIKYLKMVLESKIKLGKIVIIEENNKEGKSKILKFQDMPSERCIQLINETNNVKTLKTWRRKEKRDEIRISIKDRIEEINDYINQKDKKDKE